MREPPGTAFAGDQSRLDEHPESDLVPTMEGIVVKRLLVTCTGQQF